MKRLSKFVFLVALLAVAGAGVFLATWDIPAPVASVEKEIPNDRFPR